MYMVAERGRNHPLKVTTIQFFEDLSVFMRQCHIDYINECASPGGSKRYRKRMENLSFGNYLADWFAGRWFIYECKPTELNKKTKKPKRPTNLCGGKYSYYRDDSKEEFKLIQVARELGYNVDD